MCSGRQKLTLATTAGSLSPPRAPTPTPQGSKPTVPISGKEYLNQPHWPHPEMLLLREAGGSETGLLAPFQSGRFCHSHAIP